MPVEVEVSESNGLYLSRELLDFGILKTGGELGRQWNEGERDGRSEGGKECRSEGGSEERKKQSGRKEEGIVEGLHIHGWCT